ncbi:MAG: regulatory iron-sulfur-containing complex subunit RicT [Thermodesulfovibrio sp.]|uniref:PSP1 domain-containing protein n=1 Tax=unclassified Thermodesulfovibrio TaxID=2645936 RepID=UPI000839E8D0|nr:MULTISPECIES: regulatory iron-sulfur-containing complex subunit RicT [unclassified Thermodesulfovibrio]MDI1471698.1 regulatory iron-sulfur-containing complex subunit RicT [Thermodesulfovibrio sp. 1176]MDI6713589.1 regulatory iron-sulfur-containing complex subunit RicT [Thermodesulfovibrio sp.]ODA44275.1 Signal peptidase-like protein [Thermodesulfovibrio sp. N1]
MSKIVYVRLRPFGKVYRYFTNIEEIQQGNKVVVEGDFGLTIGTVLAISQDNADSLKPVIRVATDEDIENFEKNLILEKEAKNFCLERINERKLPMKLLVVECALDRRRIIFYFTAEGRIDFRELVKDLASKFKTRIEMRQIGVRDESKYLGGIGVCGMEICCKKYISFFKPISLKMAKEQEITLNVSKLSGVCGRLKCCLRYEYFGEIEEVVDEEIITQDEKEPEIKRISHILKGTEDETFEESRGGKNESK